MIDGDGGAAAVVTRSGRESFAVLAAGWFTIPIRTVGAPFKWVTPDLLNFGLMIGIGILGALAQYLLIEGIRRAPASVVSPLEFTALIWSFVLGYLIWADMPGLNVFAGAVLIMASGGFIVIEEWRRAKAAPA